MGRRFSEAGHVRRIISVQLVKRQLKFKKNDSMVPRRLPQTVQDVENAGVALLRQMTGRCSKLANRFRAHSGPVPRCCPSLFM